MSTSTKTPKSIRQGGPGASHENAKAPLEIKKPPPVSGKRKFSKVSGAAVNATFTTPTIPNRRVEASDEHDQAPKNEKAERRGSAKQSADWWFKRRDIGGSRS
jgi:hypothetical protein